MKDLQAGLQRRRLEHLYRRRRIAEGPQRPEQMIDGRPVVSFCSNDYLGLASHPIVAEAFREGVARWGTGSGAAHLITGHTAAHHALEEELADFTDRPRTLLFSTGYMANLGVVGALAGRGDTVFEDRLNHASLLDAGLCCGARVRRYRHADAGHLDSLYENHEHRDSMILTDGVFSMDGDLAPLPELAAIAAARGAWLMVDDAHGLGVLGDNGAGTLEHHDLSADQVPILMGTLGKAFGTFGAFVAGGEDLIETLIQSARTWIYTTAPPPALAEATRTSLGLVREEPWRRERLRALVTRFREGAARLGLPLMDSFTPIQPLLVGEAGKATSLSDALLARGLLVAPIRPPTVPPGSARLRITLSAAHTEAQVDRLLEALGQAMDTDR